MLITLGAPIATGHAGFSSARDGKEARVIGLVGPNQWLRFLSRVREGKWGEVDAAKPCRCHTMIHVGTADHLGYLVSHSSRGMRSRPSSLLGGFTKYRVGRCPLRAGCVEKKGPIAIGSNHSPNEFGEVIRGRGVPTGAMALGQLSLSRRVFRWADHLPQVGTIPPACAHYSILMPVQPQRREASSGLGEPMTSPSRGRQGQLWRKTQDRRVSGCLLLPSVMR